MKSNTAMKKKKKKKKKKKLFSPAIRLKFKQETSEMLHLQHSLYGEETWDTSEST